MSFGVLDPCLDRESVEASLLARQDDIDFESEPELASRIAASGLSREIGTPNDQLSSHFFSAGSGARIPVECARSEVIAYRGNVGVRIWYEHHERLETPNKGLQALLHPSLSFHPDGTIRQLVIFPLTVARIARLEGAQLVIVPRWARELSFAHPESQAVPYYKDFEKPEHWARVPDWTTHFCRLTESRRIPFFTTHDLADHIAGFQGSEWGMLVEVARRMRVCLESLFRECPSPPLQTLVLPFMAGYLLDVLAQPRHVQSDRILVVIDMLLEAIDARAIRAREPGVLRRFPQSYSKVLELMRASSPSTSSLPDEVRRSIQDVVVEMKQHLH